MPLTTEILCDGCQTKKKDTNHWYTVTFREHTAEVSLLILKPDGRPYAERDGLQQYYCGRYCILEAMNKWMDALTRQPPLDPRGHFQLKNPQVEHQTQPVRKAIVLKRSAEALRKIISSDRPT